ncbi:MAG TPA: hypothetical protein VGS41_07430, partial [Chthonomonadales bacterium]|nr:hypothetical protein [Chthonomonadales bacterium]
MNALESRSDRFGWSRVAIFFGGVLLSVLAYFRFGWWLSLAGTLAMLAVYSVVAYLHRRITRSMTRYRILAHIKSTQLARMRLDWEHIPAVQSDTIGLEHPFEIDLDISGKRSLHQLLNTAVSQDGSQRLRDWLLSTNPNVETIAYRQALIRELAPLTIFRDKLLMKTLLATHNQGSQWNGKRLLLWLDEHQTSYRFLPFIL